MKFIFSFVLFFLFLNCLATAQTLIQNCCKKSSTNSPDFNYDICVQYLEKDPQCKNATNLKELVIALTKNAASKSANLKKIAEEILKDKKLKRGIESNLRDCVEFYDDANDSLNNTLTLVNLGKYMDAATALSTALDGMTSCEDGFKESDTKSPISKEDNVLRQLISIDLSFGVNLK
ncbi:pectinesterase inhibitor 12-like [Raphanus sativus]|uniref:Pectinesterase inhibitor 12-like n=1 Tax=Raphanus sativus TaxID=3726 RepID=A0A6J0M4Y2_RAPSA|nr:pectinesterase inhibitor 12-like [Raphanus sativus]